MARRIYQNEMADLKPYEKLAIAYADGVGRELLALLLLLDSKLLEVMRKGQEPLLAQMRVVWWREQFGKAVSDRAKGEPLLQQLSNVEMKIPELRIGHYATQLAEAWEILAVAGEDAAQQDWEKHSRLRAAAVFGAYAEWQGVAGEVNQKAIESGVEWASSIWGQGHARKFVSTGLKPLDVLALGARLDNETSTLKRIGGASRLALLALTGL
jgi:phytoene synthase